MRLNKAKGVLIQRSMDPVAQRAKIKFSCGSKQQDCFNMFPIKKDKSESCPASGGPTSWIVEP